MVRRFSSAVVSVNTARMRPRTPGITTSTERRKSTATLHGIRITDGTIDSSVIDNGTDDSLPHEQQNHTGVVVHPAPQAP